MLFQTPGPVWAYDKTAPAVPERAGSAWAGRPVSLDMTTMNEIPEITNTTAPDGQLHHNGGDRAGNATSPRELPEYFTGRGEVRGFTFQMIRKSDHGYIYQVNHHGLVHYEIFKRIINERFSCIGYPGSASFGVTAWQAKAYKEALVIFNNL